MTSQEQDIYFLGGVLEGAKTKINRLTHSRQRMEYDPQGTRNGFGNANKDFNTTIQTGANVLDLSTGTLDGKIKVEGATEGVDPKETVKFCGDASSMIEQLIIYVGGAPVVKLNRNAWLVAEAYKKLYLSSEEMAINNVKTLRDVDLVADGTQTYSFSIPLRDFGLDLKKLLPTSSTPIDIQIVFKDNMPLLFKAGSTPPTGAKNISYTLSNLKFTFEAYHLTDLGSQVMLKKVSPMGSNTKGIVNRFHGYDCQFQTIAVGTTHAHQFNIKKRDIISSLIFPVYKTVPDGNKLKNISAATFDPVRDYSFVDSNLNFVSDYRLQFTGQDYVNVNGAQGESNYVDHFEGVVRCAKPDFYSRSYASEYSKQMVQGTNTCQYLGGLFLKTPEDSQNAVSNGFNSLVGTSVLVAEFNSADNITDTASKQLVCLYRFKRQLELGKGSAQVVE
jgi:hypothetical protein